MDNEIKPQLKAEIESLAAAYSKFGIPIVEIYGMSLLKKTKVRAMLAGMLTMAGVLNGPLSKEKEEVKIAAIQAFADVSGKATDAHKEIDAIYAKADAEKLNSA